MWSVTLLHGVKAGVPSQPHPLKHRARGTPAPPVHQSGRADTKVNALAYADDVCIAASSKEEAQDLLDRCAAFGDWAGPRFNVRKCGSLCMVNQAPRIYENCLFTPHLGTEVTQALTCGDTVLSTHKFILARESLTSHVRVH